MKDKRRFIRFVLILAVAGAAYWQRDRLPTVSPPPGGEAPRKTGTSLPGDRGMPGAGDRGPVPPAKAGEKAKATPENQPVAKPPAAKASPAEAPSGQTKVRGYDKFTDARLVDHEKNDGDSFTVSAGGREFELRLYFVDAPEKYLSDRYEDQRRRVSEQARELGGISPEEAVAVGQLANEFTKQQLRGKSFTVYTNWEEVYEGPRFYGFVELADGSYLGAKLVEEGLARIHTKGPGSKENPVPTPDGATFFQHRDKLEAIERKAQQAKRGAWKY